jgi:hypothetical protein
VTLKAIKVVPRKQLKRSSTHQRLSCMQLDPTESAGATVYNPLYYIRLRLAVASRSVTLSAGLQVEDPFALELQKAGATQRPAPQQQQLQISSFPPLAVPKLVRVRPRLAGLWSKVVVPRRKLLDKYWLGTVP